jgi:hypothetical protein
LIVGECVSSILVFIFGCLEGLDTAVLLAIC